MVLAHGGAAGLALEMLPLIVLPALLIVALLRAGRVKDTEDPEVTEPDET